jgi:phage-related protein
MKHLTGTDGLYQIRVEFQSNIYRIFCCFDKGQLVVLFNGIQKKTQKTPKSELDRAERLKKEYFKSKK